MLRIRFDDNQYKIPAYNIHRCPWEEPSKNQKSFIDLIITSRKKSAKPYRKENLYTREDTRKPTSTEVGKIYEPRFKVKLLQQFSVPETYIKIGCRICYRRAKNGKVSTFKRNSNESSNRSTC